MKVPTRKCKVNIIFKDGTFVKGYVYIPEGLRELDFFNNIEENFIAVTQAKLQNIGEVHSFRMVKDKISSQPVVFINKNAIKCITEIECE